MAKKKLTIVAIVIAFLLIVISTIYASVSIQSDHNNSENTIDSNEFEYEEQQSDVIIEESTDEKSVFQSEIHKTEVPEGYIGIYTVDDLDYIKSSPQYNYILMNDLNFNDYKDEWDEYDLSGIFDGNNYTISNYNSKHPLFKCVGAIFNLTLNNANVNEVSYDSALSVGYSESDGNGGIKRIHYSSILCGAVRGIEGYEICIDNCHVNGNISVSWKGDESSQKIVIGGICAVLRAGINLSNCSFNGKINAEYTNKEYSTEFDIGGITGMACGSSYLIYCNSSGNINAYSKNDYCKFNVGGIVGKGLNSNIQSCGNNMGIFGDTRSSSYGGIIGCGDYIYGGGYITKSFNKGNITSSSEWNHEEAYTTTSLGGIVGEGYFVIENCYNTADIIGGEIAGGIIGETSGANISKVYNTGNVNCNKYKEWNQDENEVFHRGAIEGSATNKDYGSLNYCYYTNNDINAVYDNPKFPYVQHLSKDNAKNKDCYQGFDFDNEWEIGKDDYPYPKLTNVNGQ